MDNSFDESRRKVYKYTCGRWKPLSVEAKLTIHDFELWFSGEWIGGVVHLASERALFATLGQVGFACWSRN